MATKAKHQAEDEPEIEIPESDDLPDDEEDGEVPVADDEPHGHLHTPGYPDHIHKDHSIAYVAERVNEAGGLHLFPESRHDADRVMAESVQAEVDQMNSLLPLMNAFLGAAEPLGWSVGDEPRSWIADKTIGLFSLFGKLGSVEIRVEYHK